MQRFVDPVRHLTRRHPDVLQPKGHLTVDHVVDRLQLGILEDKAHGSGQASRGRRDDILALDLGGSRDATAVEVRHQAVQDAQQGRFSAP